jgi:hypothetical protein
MLETAMLKVYSTESLWTIVNDGIAADHLSIVNLRVSAAEQEPKPDVPANWIFRSVTTRADFRALNGSRG